MNKIRRMVLSAEFGSLEGYRAHVVAERDACSARMRAAVDDAHLAGTLAWELADWEANLRWVDGELAKETV